MRAIKNAGFDDVMIWWGEGVIHEDNTSYELFDAACACGLNVRTAHFPSADTPSLWMEGDRGDAYEKALIRALRECGERNISHLVVHTTKKLITPPPNATGARRMAHAAETAEKYGVDIALENTRFLEYNQYLYDHVPSERMRFCFDCGHANCFTPGQDPLGRFSDRLVTMHLHDNHGAAAGDEHLMPGEGSIDFERLSTRLNALHPESYNLESHYSEKDRAVGLTMDEYLARSYEALLKLISGRLLQTA